VIMAESKDRNDEGEPMTFRENDNFEICKVFPLKPPDPCSFSIPYFVGKLKIERALYDLSTNVNLLYVP